MKRTFSLLGLTAMVLLLTVSCKKEEKDGTTIVRLNAGIEQQTGGKHFINLVDYEQFWTKGDKIKVNQIEFTAVSVDNPEHHQGYSVFEGKISEGATFEQPYYGVYPSSSEMFLWDGEEEEHWKKGNHCLGIEFKDQQNYVAGSFDPQAAPLAGVSRYGKINFQNMYSLLEFDLYSGGSEPLTISKLKFISGTDIGTNHAAVAGIVTYNQDSKKAKYDVSTLKKSMVLNCPDVIIPTGSGNAVPFVFVIPPTDMKGFTLEVYTDDANTPYATLTATANLSVSQPGNLVYFDAVAVSKGRQTIQEE